VVAGKIGDSIFLLLKDNLKLPTNREQSGLRKPVNFTLVVFAPVCYGSYGRFGQNQATLCVGFGYPGEKQETHFSRNVMSLFASNSSSSLTTS